MKRWIAKLLYYKRIRRLERVQYAAALLAQGKPDEASEMLDSARPTAWVDDLALYHFVRGKLCMETGSLHEADRHLQAAQALGLERPAVKLNQAVLRIRQCQLTEALDLLEDASLDDDPSIAEQVQVMRAVIRDADRDPPYEEISTRAKRFRSRYLCSARSEGDTFDGERTQLEEALRRQAKLSTKHLEDAALLYGSLLVRHHQGAWVLGLEARDHRVVARSILYHPHDLVTRLRGGLISSLPAPGHLPALAETGLAH